MNRSINQIANPVMSADEAWHQSLLELLATGTEVAPQMSAGAAGSGTIELLHRQVVQVDLTRPVVANPRRRLSYGFMAAEALWILSGSNDLAPLVKHVPGMAKYSDDGQTLAGAYGPPITAQLPYVVNKLASDPHTRQAVLTIWRPSPPDSKDTPCTIAMSFLLRRGRLHQHVFMRSSDLWLGVPYDVFSFSMVALKVLTLLNDRLRAAGLQPADPGALTITAASSHVYTRNLQAAEALLNQYSDDLMRQETYGPPYALPDPLDPSLALDWAAIEADLRRVEAGEAPLTWRWRP